MLPKEKGVELPLLEVLVEIGGQGKPKDIYPLVTKKFPGISDADLTASLPSGGNRWTNASLKKGAVPIILLNGESIIDLMIQKGIGVERVPFWPHL